MAILVVTDSAGRPVADAVVSVAGAPGDVPDIAMVTDAGGEVALPDAGAGVYDVVVFAAGTAHRASVRIGARGDRATVVVGH